MPARNFSKLRLPDNYEKAVDLTGVLWYKCLKHYKKEQLKEYKDVCNS